MYYSAMKKNEIISFAGEWMELEIIMLNEISQTQHKRTSIASFSPMWNLEKKRLYESRSCLPGKRKRTRRREGK
jgi:hypothetical protein